jgi:hypothetical protein
MPPKAPHELAVHVGAQDKAEAVDVLELLALLRKPWWGDAACRGAGAVMFPKRERPEDLARAYTYCDRCTVIAECRNAGLGESNGVWGGHFREPHRSRRMTVGNCLLDGRWWSTADLALTVGRSEAHIRAQIKKLGNRWRIEVRTVDDDTEYRKGDE